MDDNRIFTEAIIAQLADVPLYLANGYTVRDIADAIGCRPGTLKAKCAQLGISLRRPKQPERAAEPPQPRVKASCVRLIVELPGGIVDLLEARAHRSGTTEQKLAASLLTVIARDDLFVAVLDEDAPKDKAA